MITLVAGVIAMVAGTWLGAPIATPIVMGAAIGLLAPRRASRIAALAAVVAWGGLLILALVRGDAISALASTLGGAMGVPGWGLVIVTLLYPAVLASTAAWLAQLLSPRRTATSPQLS